MPLISKTLGARLLERLQDRFIASNRKLVKALFAKGARTRDWESRFAKSFKRYALQQAILGKGSPLTASELAAFNKRLAFHLERLARFGDQVGLQRMRHKPISREAMINRMEMYAGFGRSEYYLNRGKELAKTRDDLVEDYVAVDDEGTCSPCHAAAANGPYLPGEGDMPGDVCLGRGRCRCRRQERTDAAAARRLRRGDVAA